MARLYVKCDESWYDELNVISSYKESSVEKAILFHSKVVFPDYITIEFKQLITSHGLTSHCPDLALIKNDYSEWWLIEVELLKSDMEHMVSQVRTFTNAQINAFAIRDYMLKKGKEVDIVLNKDRLMEMLEDPPKVLVIADSPITDDYKQRIKSCGAQLCIFELYRNTNDSNAYRLVGDYPIAYEDESHCRWAETPESLVVVNPIVLGNIDGQSNIEVDHKGKLYTWMIKRKIRYTYIQCYGINPLTPDVNYVLLRTSEGKFYFKTN